MARCKTNGLKEEKAKSLAEDQSSRWPVCLQYRKEFGLLDRKTVSQLDFKPASPQT